MGLSRRDQETHRQECTSPHRGEGVHLFGGTSSKQG